VQFMISRFPNTHFEFHGHNDYSLSVANCLSAVKAGVRGLHVSVNGLGERAGNSPLESVVTALHDKMNIKTGIVETEITAVSKLVEVFSGKRISENRPIVGQDVFTQTAGVHADGDKKGNLYANPILPERFGRKRSYALGKLAGKASISENLKQQGMVLSPELEKKLLE
jgi:D-citramalate synthase